MALQDEKKNKRWSLSYIFHLIGKVRRGSKVQPIVTLPRANLTETSLGLNRQSSLLLKLPAEIRLFIWEYVLGGNVFHLGHDSMKHLVTDECRWGHCLVLRKDHPSFYPPPSWVYAKARWKTPRPKLAATNLALIQSCRLIYTEAVDMLYSCNTFNVINLSVLQHFVNHTILPYRFFLIKKLQLRWSYLYDPVYFSIVSVEEEHKQMWHDFRHIMRNMNPSLIVQIDYNSSGVGHWANRQVSISVLEVNKILDVDENTGVILMMLWRGTLKRPTRNPPNVSNILGPTPHRVSMMDWVMTYLANKSMYYLQLPMTLVGCGELWAYPTSSLEN